MAAIIILWPALVTGWLEKKVEVDLDKIRIQVPARD
jgi:hypothetical protein